MSTERARAETQLYPWLLIGPDGLVGSYETAQEAEVARESFAEAWRQKRALEQAPFYVRRSGEAGP